MCDLNKELLQEYMDGELTTLEAQLLEEHLKICSDCRKELNQLKILDWDYRFHTQLDIPHHQIDHLRTTTFDRCFSELVSSPENASLADVYKIQTSSMKLAVNYMQFLPGASLIKTAGNTTRNYVGKKLDLRKIISLKR